MANPSLLERLRDIPSGDDRPLYYDTMEEAAATIERLSAERLQLREALELMPDEIEVFRLMRLGGRSRGDQARVVSARIERIREAALSNTAENGEGGQA